MNFFKELFFQFSITLYEFKHFVQFFIQVPRHFTQFFTRKRKLKEQFEVELDELTVWGR